MRSVPGFSAAGKTAFSCLALIVAGLIFGPQLARAQDAISAPAQKQIGATKTDATKTEMVPSLIVMNARGATLQGGTLTLNGVSPNSIVFPAVSAS